MHIKSYFKDTCNCVTIDMQLVQKRHMIKMYFNLYTNFSLLILDYILRAGLDCILGRYSWWWGWTEKQITQRSWYPIHGTVQSQDRILRNFCLVKGISAHGREIWTRLIFKISSNTNHSVSLFLVYIWIQVLHYLKLCFISW